MYLPFINNCHGVITSEFATFIYNYQDVLYLDMSDRFDLVNDSCLSLTILYENDIQIPVESKLT